MKTLLDTLKGGTDYLVKRGVDEARLNMEHLLAHVLGCRRLDLYLRFDQVMQESQLAPLRALLKRRGEGEPLQHLLGTVEFHGHEFVSDHRALIPRPETEHLVSLLVHRYQGQQAPATVLDVGTGSGCIGLSLALAWPAAQVCLVDVSEDALELARLNAHRLGLEGRQIRFLRSDLLTELDAQRFELIVANLPYIPTGELAELSREVRHDPENALDGGTDGLEIVQRLIEAVPQHSHPGGFLALELHYDQAARVTESLQKLDFSGIHTAKDLAEVERFVFGTPPDVPPAPEEVEIPANGSLETLD